MTYHALEKEAQLFLAHCGQFTIDEHDRYEESTNTSANEALGMAVRVLAEQAKILQDMADAEEQGK